MSIVLAPPPSWTTVALDSTPPTVTLTVEAHVEPPDDLVLVARFNEPYGPTSMTFIDSLGDRHSIGWTALDGTTLTGIIGSTEFATGPGVIEVAARDATCNLTVVTAPVTIDRARVFDATLSIEGAFDVTDMTDHAYEVEFGVGGAFDATLGNEEPFETDALGVEPAFDTELEMTTDG